MSIDGPLYAANLAHLVDKPHAVYIVWRGDEALYVGMTSNWDARTKQHMGYFRDLPWRPAATHIDVWHCAEGRYEAEQIEYQTIRDLDPPHNTRHSPRFDAQRAEHQAELERWLRACESA